MLIKFVSAFSYRSYSGNPAGVCVVENFPSVNEMQTLATKFGLSETAFIKKLQDDNYHIRWFTPVSEAPICIHATLASAHMLYETNLVNQKAKIKFINSQASLTASKTKNWININSPSFSVKPYEKTHVVAAILKGYSVNYIGISEKVILVEFNYNYEVRKFIPQLHLISSLPCRALLITSRDDEYDFISRYFAPSVGINEDPVCGSAHCRLIPYWAQKLKKSSMIAYQASKQGGIIKCENLKNRVVISGQAVTIKSEE